MTFQIIPAIDLLDGQVVRLTQGSYNAVTQYSYNPVELAKQFEAAGATRMHVVDLNAARSGELNNGAIIRSIREATSLEIEVGGGIRSQEALAYYLDCGVTQVIIGSLFIKNFNLAATLCSQYPNKIIAGMDTKNAYVATDGWEQSSSIHFTELLDKLAPLPLHSVIFTDISKDGMMQGPNLKQLSEVATYSKHAIIASGGIRHNDDVNELKKISNLFGCIIGKALLSQELSLDTLFCHDQNSK
jgi:phosphoribosylformimino-5-aminoimidazole carboxamide ribotide isomerase